MESGRFHLHVHLFHFSFIYMFITFLLHDRDKPDTLLATEVTRMKEALTAWLGRRTYPRRVTGDVTLHENIFKLQYDKSIIDLVSFKL